MQTIPLTKGYVTTVDDRDYESLAGRSWWALEGKSGIVYAVRSATVAEKAAGLPRNIYMHRQILGVVQNREKDVDHRDHDGLNNRRTNLRCCSKTENHANQRKTRGASSYKGVQWDRTRGEWIAKIHTKRGHRNLGRFADELTAAKAYDRAALTEWGEFAWINFPLNPLP